MPLSPYTGGSMPPEKILNLCLYLFSESKIVPFSKAKPFNSSHVFICFVVGASSSPPEEAAWRKKRLGHVGPGSDEHHLSQTAKTWASSMRCGNWDGDWHS